MTVDSDWAISEYSDSISDVCDCVSHSSDSWGELEDAS